ncbi:MAG TPA: hypothetical protein VMZ25_11090 [Terriglobales bacterium]|nr:hypothetical protein [Terriglobales bacterium]
MKYPSSDSHSVLRATLWGTVVAGVLVLAIYLGSNRFRHFDAALVPYAGATVFAAFGIGYRFAMWLQRPPTRLYWFRGWKVFFQPARLPAHVLRLGQHFFNDFVRQRFIEKRSHTRWAAHWFIAWGCILAGAVTFPLSFGWVHFETAAGSQEIYNAYMFGQKVSSFRLGTPIAALTFNILNVSAVMVIIGVGLALWRRARDRGAIAVQQFAQDMMPLMMLFAISITGLFLTISTHLMNGLNYGFLSMLHAVTVIFTLLYLPFGKFFHVFQRPAQLGVHFYREEGKKGAAADCAVCGQPYATRMHMEDLKVVEAALGIDYTQTEGIGEVGLHYQDICPGCRRKSIAISQDAHWRRMGTRD